MSKARDIWYVRFPDGQVVRAKSTASVRRHLEKGRIPFDCRVRRSGQYEWITLEWAPEFADLLNRSEKNDKPAAKVEPKAEEPEVAAPGDFELHTVGVRGLVDELIVALDSTLNRTKLTTAAFAGLLSAALVLFGQLILWQFESPVNLVVGASIGLAVLAVFAICTAIIARITVVEVAQLRSPKQGEIAAHLLRDAFRLFVCWLMVGGCLVGAIVGARELPGFVRSLAVDASVRDVLREVAVVLAILLEVVLWPILGLTILLGSIIVVEECSPFRAVGQWLSLVRENFATMLIYEALAAAIAGIAALPILVPVYLAAWNSLVDPSTAMVAHGTFFVLSGAAAMPAIAYLIVANVFIYVNLRYEFSLSAK